MYKAFITLLIFLSVCLSCRVRKQEATNPGCIIQDIPFEVKNDNAQKRCLEINDLNGLCDLTLFISKKGTVLNFNVSYLKIIEGTDTLLQYKGERYQPMLFEDYPNQVQVYYPYIKKYIDNLHFSPKHKISKKNNLFSLYLKIGCKEE